MSGKQPFLLAAGGTGGHLFPALSLASVLVARGERVMLATDDRVKDHGADFRQRPFIRSAPRPLKAAIRWLCSRPGGACLRALCNPFC